MDFSACRLDIDSLVAPLPVAAFVRDYWDRQVFHHARGDTDYFAELFSANDLDLVLSLTGQGLNGGLNVVKTEDGKVSNRPFEESGQPNIYELYLAYADGFTLVVNAMDRRWRPVAALCENLRYTLGHQVGANLYVTPPQAQGFQAHCDDHDVFVLQIEGSKRWRVYPERNPSPEVRTGTAMRPGEPAEFLLVAGDLLYIPKGFSHEAATSETRSIHLTVGVHAFTWLELVTELLKTQAPRVPDLARSLAPGFPADAASTIDEAGRLLRRVAELEPTAAAVDRLNLILRKGSRPAPDGHFRSLDGLDRLTLGTWLRRRTAFEPRVSNGDGAATIEFGGNGLKAPARALPALRYVAANERMRVTDLPGHLTDNAKLVLSRRLVKAGLLSILDEREAG